MNIIETDNKSVVEINIGGYNHEFIFKHPPGTFALTIASKTLINAIVRNQHQFQGLGIDWGSGVGCLAIVAASLINVEKVYGLEILKQNVGASYENAKANKILNKVEFIHSDSYCPYAKKDRTVISCLENNIDFIVANPPSSEGDDGFGFRREVLRGGRAFLKKDGVVFLNISFQYGQSRIENLTKDIKGYHYGGLLYSTEWVQFDLRRVDLLYCLENYCHEEENGGINYTFRSADSRHTEYIDARNAYEYYLKTGESPLTRWQTHLFVHDNTP